MEEITFFLKYGDLIMLIYSNCANFSKVLWVFHENFLSWKAYSVQMRYNRPYYCKYLPRYFNKHAIWLILSICVVQRWVNVIILAYSGLVSLGTTLASGLCQIQTNDGKFWLKSILWCPLPLIWGWRKRLWANLVPSPRKVSRNLVEHLICRRSYFLHSLHRGQYN